MKKVKINKVNITQHGKRIFITTMKHKSAYYMKEVKQGLINLEAYTKKNALPIPHVIIK